MEWQRDEERKGGERALCGLFRLFVSPPYEAGKLCGWAIGFDIDHEYACRVGDSATLATAKSDAIAAAEKVLTESAALLAELKRQASAPCAKCGALARRDGMCVGCGEAVAT